MNWKKVHLGSKINSAHEEENAMLCREMMLSLVSVIKVSDATIVKN